MKIISFAGNLHRPPPIIGATALHFKPNPHPERFVTQRTGKGIACGLAAAHAKQVMKGAQAHASHTVIPAQAGIHLATLHLAVRMRDGFRFNGNDEER